jgi:hypothetical protein
VIRWLVDTGKLRPEFILDNSLPHYESAENMYSGFQKLQPAAQLTNVAMLRV